jgi:HPt (histidine-containing phosphotransfer) domain-containing protein
MFYKHGFQAFLSKPIDIMALDSVVRKWVRNEMQENLADISEISPAANISPEDESIVINIPGIDVERGLSLYSDELDIYVPLLRSYAVNTPAILDKLRTVSEETLADYVIAVHGLKGTSANIGAEMTREVAMRLEKLSRAGDLEDVLAINDRFIKDTENVIANIKMWFEQYDLKHEKIRLESPNREVIAMLRQSCENYDMNGIDKAMAELESASYVSGSDFVTWLREKINVSEISEVAERLMKYEEDLNK